MQARFVCCAALLAIVSACSDSSVTVPAVAPALTLGALYPYPKTTRDEWAEVAMTHPGFAGLWVRDDTLVISVKKGSDLNSVKGAARGWLLEKRREDILTRPMAVEYVSFDHAELRDVLRKMGERTSSVPGVTGFWVDPKRGVAMVSTIDEQTATAIRGMLSGLQLPAASYGVEVSGRGVDRACAGLQSVCSPLVAGLQVVNVTANSVCSIGPVGWKVDSLQPSQPDFNYKVILSAAHCTSSQSAVFGDVVYQPAPNRAVGYEVDEAPVYGASTCNALGKPYIYCRYADVTVYRVLDSVAIAAGNVAKSAPTTPPANPPYLGMLPYTGSGVIGVLVGELVNRVGATSGKDSALVTHDCVDKPSGLSGIYTLCMQRANIRVRDGDSGGLIYLTQGSNPKPRPAGVTSRGEDNPNAVGVYYSKMSLVLGALGYKYFVSW